MGDNSSILVSVGNIVATPHPENIYSDSFFNLREKKTIATLVGSDKLMIGNFVGTDRKSVFKGQFFVFAEIGIDAAWLNLANLRAATADEISKVSVPDNLRPNLRVFNFIFSEGNHKIYFEIRNKFGNRLNPSSLKRALGVLLNSLSDEVEFVITIQPEADAIEKVLAFPIIRQIVIDLKIPNPDDLSEVEQEIMRELDQQNAKEQKIALTKKRKAKTLVLNEKNRKIARVAAENGYVEVKGKNELGETEKKSTKSHPAIHAIPINAGDDSFEKIQNAFKVE